MRNSTVHPSPCIYFMDVEKNPTLVSYAQTHFSQISNFQYSSSLPIQRNNQLLTQLFFISSLFEAQTLLAIVVIVDKLSCTPPSYFSSILYSKFSIGYLLSTGRSLLKGQKQLSTVNQSKPLLISSYCKHRQVHIVSTALCNYDAYWTFTQQRPIKEQAQLVLHWTILHHGRVFRPNGSFASLLCVQG